VRRHRRQPCEVTVGSGGRQRPGGPHVRRARGRGHRRREGRRRHRPVKVGDLVSLSS
jgi:hypothetical protein